MIKRYLLFFVFILLAAATQAQVNDNICNAIDLTLNGPTDCQNTAAATTEANEPSPYSCSTPNNTVWYTYTPAVSGPVKITMRKSPGATTDLDAWVSFFTATGSCPSVTLTEYSSSCEEADLTVEDSVIIISDNLDAGTTYYLLIDGVVGAVGEFCIGLSDAPPPLPVPANDDICNAIPLILDGASDCQNTESATTETNEPSVFSCSTPNNTVWYTYTPTTTGPVKVNVKRNPGASTDLDAWVSFFTATGTCPSVTLTEYSTSCNAANLSIDDSASFISDPLIAGTTYYIMVDGVVGAVGGFCINIQTPPSAPSCTVLIAPVNGSTGATVAGIDFTWTSAAGADGYTLYIDTVNPPVNEVTSVPDTTVNITGFGYATTYYWTVVPTNGGVPATGCSNVFSFTTEDAPPPTACTVLLLPADGATNVAAPNADFSWMSVAGATGYDVALGTTNPPATLGNTTDTTVQITALAYSTTYYWTVYPTNGGGPAAGCTVYSFTTMAAPAAPANDDCAGAVDLSGGAMTPGTTIGGTESMPADVCNGSTGDANDDVWYTITASNAGDATITLNPDGTFDAVMEAFTGTCGTLTSLSCADDGLEGDPEVISLTGLTPGQVIYIRVFDWDVAGTEGTYNIQAIGSALPVNLVNFRGARSGAVNMLYWSTASEQHNRGFELQRSADGQNFSPVTFIQSKAVNGNSSAALAYQFGDEKPFAGNTYYRLRQTDIDGKSTLSNIVLIKGTRNNSLAMSAVYPNPAKETLKIILSAPANNAIRIIVSDMAGKIVLQQNANVITGDNTLSVDVKQLPVGSYMVKAVCTNGCETVVSKFLKQ